MSRNLLGGLLGGAKDTGGVGDGIGGGGRKPNVFRK